MPAVAAKPKAEAVSALTNVICASSVPAGGFIIAISASRLPWNVDLFANTKAD